MNIALKALARNFGSALSLNEEIYRAVLSAARGPSTLRFGMIARGA
jgi:hypothetical protein